MNDDRGAGSVLCVALVSVIALLAVMMLPTLMVFSLRHRTQATAEAAALAAAEGVSGGIPGYPCELALRAATLGGTELVSCEIDGPNATVTVNQLIAGFPLNARARAGPPGLFST